MTETTTAAALAENVKTLADKMARARAQLSRSQHNPDCMISPQSASQILSGAMLECYAAIDALAKLATPPVVAQWQPIETAPKDGTWLLVAGPDQTGARRMVCRWMADWEWESADDGYGAYINPSHWMPLPAPPALSLHQTDTKEQQR